MAGRDTVISIDTTHLEPYEPYSSEKYTSVRHEEVPDSPDTVCSPLVSSGNSFLDTVGDEDRLTPTGKAVYKILENPALRYCIYVLPVAAILAIPLTLFATKYRHVEADGISLAGIFAYIEVMWLFLWVSKLIASAIPSIFQGICSIISTGVRKYSLVLRSVEISMSIFIWTITALCLWPIIHDFDDAYYHRQRKENIPWMNILLKVIKASIVSSAIVLGEKILMQLLSVSYHGKQFKDKIHDIKATTRAIDLLYEASLRRMPNQSKETLEDDYIINDTTNVQKFLKENAADSSVQKVFGRLTYFGQKMVSAFGYIVSDITGREVMHPTATHAIVDAALERKAGAEALARRIFTCLVSEGRKAICPNVIMEVFGFGSEKEARWIFEQLDRDGNGSVTMDEMIMLVNHISQQRRDIWQSACNIRDAIHTLDKVLSVIVFGIIVIVYSAYFSNFVVENTKTLITILSASAFSFGQTVGEFNAACIQVFVKHPFDIGDRVNMNDHEYEVVRISLLYSVFRRIDTDTTMQVANCVVGNWAIDNISRSKAMKERYKFAVDVGTKLNEIELLRVELEDFVKETANNRDYQSDVEVQLVSVGDLKLLELLIEIKHKSNWANDHLRAYRRSKFMCALLSAMRKVPIYGPDRAAPPQGTINAPNFNVTIDQDTAKAVRAQYDAEKESNKSHRVVISPVSPDTPDSSSPGLEILPSLRAGFHHEEDRGNMMSRAAAYLRLGRRRFYNDATSQRNPRPSSSRPGSRPSSWLLNDQRS